MKLLTLLWCIVIFISTCTRDQSALIHHLEISFRLNPHPNFFDLLIVNDMYLQSPNWYFYKAGHAMLFLILSALASSWSRNLKSALMFTVSVAIASEIMQLFFYRDGRIYDMAIDSAGGLLTYASIALWRKL